MADSIILMVMALVVFGPRRLPQIGRQIGKLMYEFRKASNDFKFQMEEELRELRRGRPPQEGRGAPAALAASLRRAGVGFGRSARTADPPATGAANRNLPIPSERPTLRSTRLKPSDADRCRTRGRITPAFSLPRPAEIVPAETSRAARSTVMRTNADACRSNPHADERRAERHQDSPQPDRSDSAAENAAQRHRRGGIEQHG